jgi:hypothetical protein
MKQWGLFVKEQELDDTVRKIKKLGHEIFEVRELTFVEILTYVANDPILAASKPHVIMFYATDRGYKKLLRKLKLVSIF